MPPPSSSSTDELQALRAELAAMKGELRVVTVERDLLREKLKAYQRQLFASKSEVRGAEQRDLFLNEAEALAMGCEPVQETETEQSVEVGAHERNKRGRKPLDPMLPREVVRHELPELERVCAHDGHALVEIGAEISEQLDIVPQQVRVIRTRPANPIPASNFYALQGRIVAEMKRNHHAHRLTQNLQTLHEFEADWCDVSQT